MSAMKKLAFCLALFILAGCKNSLLEMRNPHAEDGPDNLPALTGWVYIDQDPSSGILWAYTFLVGSGTIFYQWRRDGKDIQSTIAPWYIPASDDIGMFISVTVTRDGYSGSVSASFGPIAAPGGSSDGADAAPI
jgi:hypothetical protein